MTHTHVTRGPEAVDRDGQAAERLVVSIVEAGQSLGISDDLVYELTERGELPCVRLGRRKVIPVRAIEMILERAIENFDPGALLSRLGGSPPTDG